MLQVWAASIAGPSAANVAGGGGGSAREAASVPLAGWSAPVTMMYSITPQHHTSEQDPSKKLCISACPPGNARRSSTVSPPPHHLPQLPTPDVKPPIHDRSSVPPGWGMRLADIQSKGSEQAAQRQGQRGHLGRSVRKRPQGTLGVAVHLSAAPAPTTSSLLPIIVAGTQAQRGWSHK